MFSRQEISKLIFKCLFICFVIIGTYNAVVINAQSELSGSHIKFVKRLDEVYGIVTPGRMVATSTTWKKISSAEYKKNPIVQVVKRIDSSNEVQNNNNNINEDVEPEVVASIQEDLNLGLVEVLNAKKWPNGLSASDFSGSLNTREGVIENLSASLPGEESISVSFTQMSGNIFEYEANGEVYSAMIYQIDQASYMVSLTNGPLEGTRLRFADSGVNSNPEVNDVPLEQEVVAGNFGEDAPVDISSYDEAIQNEAVETQTFKF